MIDQGETEKSLGQKELYWYDSLKTCAPFGLNERDVSAVCSPHIRQGSLSILFTLDIVNVSLFFVFLFFFSYYLSICCYFY